VWGHVSHRDPDGRGVWIKAGPCGFDEVTDDDVILIDSHGERLRGEHAVPYEYPIHTEILSARPDVAAVVHVHSPYAIALGVSGHSLGVFSNAAGPFARDGVARFDRPVGLINTPELGAELARSLGAGRAALLIAHGTVAVGTSVATAVTTAILLERACRLQILVAAAGGPALECPEPRGRYAHTESDRYLMRTWEHLLRRAEVQVR
jgi:ribulose-5-phosphate 4-epimerase/fuculose-1-phosphate aldolase